jgi:glutamate:GABA antiporter
MSTKIQQAPQLSQPSKDTTLKSAEYTVKAMPSILGGYDMTAIYLMIIFFITNVPTAASGGPAAFTFLLLGGITFFIPSVIATAQLATMFPHEGSLYHWTHQAFGGFWSFFSAFCAWFPGILVMVSAGDVVVSFIQGLNSNWLADPREQGVVIIAIIILASIFATQRFRTVQNVVNVVVALTFLAVFIIGVAGVVWLVQGHPSATNFSDLQGWNINWAPSTGNINLFGLVALAYLGAEGPLNMAGEMNKHSVIRKHLLWGTVLVFIGYFVATFSELVVLGAAKASASPFSLITMVDTALGKFYGDIATICLLSFFVVTIAVYTYTYARLPLVAAIDQRLPVSLGKLNKHRVPAFIIGLQALFACAITFVIFFAIPFVPGLGSPTNLTTEVYNVMLAASALVWAFSTLFLFVNISIFYFRDKVEFNRKRIFPLPVLFVIVPLGSISCVLAIIDTMFYSWIGTLINNLQWLIAISSVTFVCIIIAIIGSMIASSEASWEGMRE